MLDDINDRLMQAKERLRTKQKLDSMLREAKAILKEERRQCEQHEELLASEKADVDKLEGFSLTGLFYTILGTKEDRLKQERQEYLAAKLKYENCAEAVKDARNEVEQLTSELAGYANTEAEYNRLIDEKQQLLAVSGDQRTQTLLNLSERLVDLEADRKELREAVRAGEAAQRTLEQVLSELRSAENWGTWDMVGGGMLATMAKHSKIDSAKQQAIVAQRHLRHFQEELADADQRLHVSLEEISGFTSFADYFFDGLIADWIVQSKVQQASEACSSAIRKVTAALNECRQRLSTVERESDQVSTQRREFIERA